MKKILSLLSLAALTIGLLGSCSKINERLDNLEKEVSGIENEQIASINSQIDGIKTSIADLGTIRSDISSLKQSASGHSVDIFNLEEADRALKDRILNLEDYVDAVLPNYAEKEWVEATFSTLEQYEATCDTIAKIDAKIGTTSEKLSKDIQACADSLTKWVNKTFEGYYTAAQMDAKLTEMKAAIDSAKAAGGITDAKADSIAAELTKTKAAVDTAKANIRKEYRAAIDTAIKTSEGKLTKALQEKITEVNGKIESLTTRVGKLETSVADLTGRIVALESMIQTVAIVPEYNDGSVKVEDDTLYIDCIVSPVSAVSGLTKANFKVLVNKVLTKAVDVKTISITEDKWFSKDEKNGTVSLKVPVKNYIPESADSSLTVAVNVKNGVSNYTTEFVPITLPVRVRLDKHSIVVPYRTLDSIVTLTATVKNAKNNNVNWESTGHGVASVDNQGKVTIAADKIGKDTVVVKTVEGNATDTCFITALPKGALAGEFSVSATKKVHFSQGNLTYNVSTETWAFYEHQYDCATGYDSNLISLFTWGYGTWSTSPNGTSYQTGDFTDWGSQIGDGNTWRTLSTEEWQYLFSYDGSESDGQNYDNDIRRGKYKYGVTVCSKAKCVVLLPDNWDETVISLANFATQNTYDENSTPKWSEMQAAGAVCLPAAGSREGSIVYSVGGRCWSSTAYDEYDAYLVYLSSGSVKPGNNDHRKFGFSVRLVTEVK